MYGIATDIIKRRLEAWLEGYDALKELQKGFVQGRKIQGNRRTYVNTLQKDCGGM